MKCIRQHTEEIKHQQREAASYSKVNIVERKLLSQLKIVQLHSTTCPQEDWKNNNRMCSQQLKLKCYCHPVSL